MNNAAPRIPLADDSKASLDALRVADLMWQPYLAMSHALLITQQNAAGFMTVNRELAVEMQAIFRRSRELAIKISEKTIERATAPSRTMMSASELDEMYDFAVSGMREVGDAALAAHVRSIEALRDHARNMITVAGDPASPAPKT